VRRRGRWAARLTLPPLPHTTGLEGGGRQGVCPPPCLPSHPHTSARLLLLCSACPLYDGGFPQVQYCFENRQCAIVICL
jgi:hypothetical protein